MKAIYILVLSTFLYSCSDNYEQDYNDFTEFNQADWSLQSWFPNLISTDCFNLKEIHNLKTNSSFGRSSYKSNNRINSLLPDVKLYKKATFDSLNKFLEEISKPKRPNWFIGKAAPDVQTEALYEQHKGMHEL